MSSYATDKRHLASAYSEGQTQDPHVRTYLWILEDKISPVSGFTTNISSILILIIFMMILKQDKDMSKIQIAFRVKV